MYKSGKNWVIATLFAVTLGTVGIQTNNVMAHADDHSNVSSVTSSSASTNQNNNSSSYYNESFVDSMKAAISNAYSNGSLVLDNGYYPNDGNFDPYYDDSSATSSSVNSVSSSSAALSSVNSVSSNSESSSTANYGISNSLMASLWESIVLQTIHHLIA